MNQAEPIVILSTAQASVQSSVILSVAKDPIRPATLIRPNRQFSRNLVILKRAFSARFRTYALPALLTFTALLASASAQTLTGTVKNVTTGKPGAGDDVVLITLSQGMEEAGRTKADAKGNFSFKLDQQGPHLIRVIHQDVTYHRMAPPGTTSVEVEVYDVGKKVEGIEIVADIMRFQAGNGNMQVDRTFAVQNNSKPPRTQMNEHNLEFFVPEGAKITEGQAMTAGGQPVKSDPAPEGSNTSKYSFLFPLRPGETRFNVVYTMPYTGSVNIDPKSVYPLEHFVAIAPKAMQFAPATDGVYKVAPFPGQPDANVEVASNTRPGQSMAFKLTGEGELAAPVDENGQSGQSGPSAQTSGPGGGLGPPIDAPDPLQKYRWWILGGIAAVLVIGGVVVASRQQAANRAAARAMTARGLSPIETDDEFEIPAAPAKRAARPAHEAEVRATEERPSRGSSKLLEGLKEELFELEVEHKQGRITQQEYEQTKAALDQTLQRALKRESQKA